MDDELHSDMRCSLSGVNQAWHQPVWLSGSIGSPWYTLTCDLTQVTDQVTELWMVFSGGCCGLCQKYVYKGKLKLQDNWFFSRLCIPCRHIYIVIWWWHKRVDREFEMLLFVVKTCPLYKFSWLCVPWQNKSRRKLRK